MWFLKSRALHWYLKASNSLRFYANEGDLPGWLMRPLRVVIEAPGWVLTLAIGISLWLVLWTLHLIETNTLRRGLNWWLNRLSEDKLAEVKEAHAKRSPDY